MSRVAISRASKAVRVHIDPEMFAAMDKFIEEYQCGNHARWYGTGCQLRACVRFSVQIAPSPPPFGETTELIAGLVIWNTLHCKKRSTAKKPRTCQPKSQTSKFVRSWNRRTGWSAPSGWRKRKNWKPRLGDRDSLAPASFQMNESSAA